MLPANGVMAGSYDYGEVARSVLIAIAASYVALDLTGRVTAAKGRVRLAWLSGGAVAMGIGIWAMHFKGMLAFHLPVPVEYHWPTVLASLLVAILASAVALYLASRRKMGHFEALTGSVIMGAAIAGMHYIGMAAMRLPASTRFSPMLVTCSVLLAVLFSLIALLMAFGLRGETRWTVPRRLGSATVMGVAVSAMHYTGMAAASFISASPPDLSYAVSISAVGNNAIAIVTLIVLVAAMVTSSVDRRATTEIRRLNEDLERRVAERTSQLEAANLALRKEIAEHGRAEQSLQLFRMLIDQSNDAIEVIDPETLRFIDVNGRACLDLGYTREELLSMSVYDIDPNLDESMLARVTKQLRDSGSAIFESVHRRQEGSTFPVEVSIKQVHLDRSYRVSLARDITERKRAEEALRKSQADLARVARVATLGELTASIAHEINQPLAAVAANASAALRWLAVQPPNLEEAREAVSSTIQEADRASGVIARIRALLQKVPPQLLPLDANELIREALVLAEGELLRGGVAVKIELTADVPAVLGDRGQLQQVMLNLTLNAIDAMSIVSDRRRQLLVKSSKHADGLLIQVEDSGIGLDPEQAERIFEPFFTTKPQGIGLGLSISRSIVEAHGGRLWATPGAPYGAVFQFVLPPAVQHE
jgi:PAS domain S-box-containing protein